MWTGPNSAGCSRRAAPSIRPASPSYHEGKAIPWLAASASRLFSAGQIDTQQALLSFQREAALLDLAQEAIVVWDAATDFATNAVYWSDEMFQLLGHDPEEVTPSFATFVDAVHPDDRALIRAFMKDAHVARPAPFEFRTVGPREVVRDAAGRGTLIFGTALDMEAVTAVRRALRGEAILDAGRAAELLHRWITEPEASTKTFAVPMTPREREVLQLLSQGLTNRQIGHAFTLSAATVKTHVEHILAKLGVADRTQAAVRGIELDLISVA